MTLYRSYIHYIYIRTWRLLFIAAALCVAVVCHAQNNPFKINNELYKLYNDAYSHRLDPTGVELSKQLYRRAVAIGDRKAQCLALTIPMLYNYYKRDDKGFETSLKELQEKALQLHYEQYFYFGVSNKVNYLLNRKRLSDAYTYIQEMEAYARRNKSAYGIYTGLNSLGVVHTLRMEIGLAAETYRQALKVGKEFLKDQEMAPVYRKLSECYEELYKYDEMYDVAGQGFEIAKSKPAKLRLLRSMAYASFMTEKYDLFKKNYDLYCSINGSAPNAGSSDRAEKEMAILKLLYDRNFKTAIKYIETISSRDMRYRYRLLIEYYRLQGDFQSMSRTQTTLYRSRIRMQDSVRSQNFTELNAKFINQKLEYENQQLEMDRQRLLNERQSTELKNTNLKLANTQLTLRNSSLELRRAQSSSDLLKLSYDNKQLEADKLQNELDAEKAQKKLHDTLLWSAVAIALLVLVAVSMYVWNHHKLMLRLKNANTMLEKNNEELSVAKEKAVAADKVKTVFIQNMSHEIRTPLNAIVGFSELIAGDDGSMSESEREDFSDRIKTNSENLLMLVGDVLDTAQLESGTYSPQYRSATIGEICRKAMAAVGVLKQANVSMRMDTDMCDNYVVHTDVKRVVQVLVNMLTNAEKNTEKGCITLGCSLTENPGMVTFYVADTGIGVSVEKEEEIFRSFTKLDSFKQGLGLGLHICRIIADLLGGRIFLDRNYKDGARFLFTIKM